MARARRPDSGTASVDEIADELYALPPSDFTARRDEFVRAAKAAGDSDTAKAVRALRKPSTAAWLVNQLVRAHRDDVSALLSLGSALRQAQSRLEGPQLRELSRQRRQAVNALVHQARQLAIRLDRPVPDGIGREVERTLEAALASTDAADQVESGRLTTVLASSAGFDAARPHLQVVRPQRQEQAGRRQVAAKAQVTAAMAAAKEADAELAQRMAGHERWRSTVEELEARIRELTQQLHDSEERARDAKRQEQQAKKELTAAERAARRAQLAVEAARTDLDR